MNTFQILTIIIPSLAIAGAIVGVYVSTRVAIAKIQVELIEMRKDLFQKELAILNIEKNNREDFKENRIDHKEILEKVNTLVETLIR
jgi:hypothetical protein